MDVVNLQGLGLQQETTRDLGLLAIVGCGWNICNSWAGISATLALSIMSGGSVTLVYGVIIIFIVVGCSALTMAEMASVYPTAGGQYQSVYVLDIVGSTDFRLVGPIFLLRSNGAGV